MEEKDLKDEDKEVRGATSGVPIKVETRIRKTRAKVLGSSKATKTGKKA